MTPFRMRRFFLLALCALTLWLTGCGLLRSTPRLGDSASQPLPVGQTAWLVCSTACRAQEQCGVLAENRDQAVVLLNVGRPATLQHDALLGNNAPVTIVQVLPQQMVKQNNPGQQTLVNFYQVRFQIDGRDADAWVAGWCIADRQAE